jgi:hypothetical protein
VTARHVRTRLRQAIKVWETTGVTVKGVETTGGGHLRVRITLPGGEERVLICGSTPSDRRALHNSRAVVRRWVRRGSSDRARVGAGR